MLEGGRRLPATWASLPQGSAERREVSHAWVGPAVRVVVLGSVALLAALRGAWVLVAVALGSAVVLTVLAVFSPRAARAIDRAAAKVGHGAIHVVSTIGVGVIEVFVVLPGRVVALVRRRSGLNGVGRAPGSTWRPRSAISGRQQADRPWMRDVPGHHRRSGRSGPRLLRFVPYVVALLVLDLVAGTLVAERTQVPWLQPSQVVLGAPEPGIPGVPGGSYADLRGAAALTDDPQAGTCLSEADGLTYDYVQYLARGIRDTTGSCITVLGGVRSSYQPAEADVPEVWILGGSAAFGIGQRDEHTIASELARQTEADGKPIQVVNVAVPGFTAYQEALRLEQLLAVRKAPDLVILYDGMNDVGAQLAAPYGLATWLPTVVWRSDAPANERTLWQRWADHSLLAHVADEVRGQPAGAAPAQAGDEASDDVSDETVAAGTVAVLGRSHALAARIGSLRGVPVVSVFQATDPAQRGRVADLVIADLPDGVIDASGAFAPEERPTAFFDSVHVDEAGAAQVAAWLRTQLASTVIGKGGR